MYAMRFIKREASYGT